MKLTAKQIIFSILAIFVMFMPRRLSILGMFSFRIFIILAVVLAFLVFRIRIKLSGVLLMPTFWIYIGLMLAVQLAHVEFSSMLVPLLDIVALSVVLNSVLETKEDIDFFVRLFLIMLIIYSVFCFVELFTGFTPWKLLGAVDRSTVRFGLHRSFGAYTTSNNNGSFLLLTFPVSWYAQKNFPDKRLSAISIAATWIALICTISRAQILAAIILYFIIIWRTGFISFFKRHFIKILIVLLVVAVLLLIPSVRSMFGNFFNMFQAIFDSSAEEEISESFGSNAGGVGERTMLYSWVWQELKGHYWFGMGATRPLNHLWRPNQWQVAVKKSIENHYLSTLFRYGIVGLIALLSFFTQSTVFMIGKYRSERRAFSLKKASESIQFRIMITMFCFFVVLFTVAAMDDYRMFFVLLVFAEAYHRIMVLPQSSGAGSQLPSRSLDE